MDLHNLDPEAFESVALHALFDEFTDKNIRYAVLRNYEQLPHRVGSRDIDLLIHPDDIRKAVEAVRALTLDLGLLVSDYFKDDMFVSIWLCRRLTEGSLFTLSVDLFRGRRVYGMELYSFEDAMSQGHSHNGIPVVGDAFVLLDKWLYHLVVGKPTPPKYDDDFALIADAEYVEIVENVARFIGQDEARRRIDATRDGVSSSLSGLSVKNRLRALRKFYTTRKAVHTLGFLKFLCYRLRDLIKLRGLFLSISGPDGSGKTTVIDQVIGQLERIYGKGNIRYAHFRPTVLPRIAEVAKKARALDQIDEDYDRPHRANPSGFGGSLVRLGYYGLDYVVGYLRSVRPILQRREVMLFDRYFYDMIADSFRSRISLPMPLLRMVGCLIPLPHYAFFIKVDPKEIYRRKQELTHERIVELNDRYGDLERRGWLVGIDNNGAPQHAADAIIDHIVAGRDHKLRKLLTVT